MQLFIILKPNVCTNEITNENKKILKDFFYFIHRRLTTQLLQFSFD